MKTNLFEISSRLDKLRTQNLRNNTVQKKATKKKKKKKKLTPQQKTVTMA